MSQPSLREAQLLRESGRAAEAQQLCLRILDAAPDDAAALNLLALLALDADDVPAAQRWAERAVKADTGFAPAHYTLGFLDELEGRFVDAEASYERSLDLDPNQAKVHNNLGAVLQMQGKLEQAITSFRRALAIDPGLVQAKQNLASIVRDRNTLEQAAEGYRQRTAAHPEDADAWVSLGNTYRELAMPQEALASFAEALRRNPDHVDAHFSRAFVLLLCEQYPEGWREFEWRWKVAGAKVREFRQPTWAGNRLRGTLLVHAEQGLGDMLQFARYAALAAQRCDRVILECQKELVPLLRGVTGLADVVPQGAALPRFDAHVPMMSLARIFETTIDTIPWEGSYVAADPLRRERWRQVIPPNAGLKVGLVWAGRPEQWDDRKRSITLEALAPLARVEGVTFFSLQKGAAAEQAQNPPAGMRLVNCSPQIADFADTAAIVSELDLVITIDTSVVHLAGAMGAPTWALIARAPDWRWHVDREDNPWYPTMRLFRQTVDGDWSQPIGKAGNDLHKLARQRGQPACD